MKPARKKPSKKSSRKPRSVAPSKKKVTSKKNRVQEASKPPVAKEKLSESSVLKKIKTENLRLTGQLEQRNRELEIEAALERVRARTMAMQKSEELVDAANILFKQLQSLGIPAWSCGFNIWKKDDKSFTGWMSSEGMLQPPFMMPLRENPTFIRFLESKEKGETFYVEEVGGKALVAHYKYMLSQPDFAAIAEKHTKAGYPLRSFQINHVANFKHGNLIFITAVPVPEAHEVLKRFAIVFEQTYTRFLDLQKAEAQARQAQIETAMEKVRARSLAMQKPAELTEVAEVLRSEMGALGVEDLETSSIYIVDGTTGTSECWYAIKDVRGKNKRLVTDHMTLRLDETWVGRQMKKFHRSKETRVSIVMQGENRKEWINHCAEKSSVLKGYYGGEIPERTYHLLKFSNGFIGAASPGKISDESWDLLQRVTSVFSFAYKRFSDLQKAEEQAREAQIETALERVRSRSLAMQKSEELKEVIQVVYEQFNQLNILIEHTGFIVDYKERDDMHIWLTDKYASPFEITIPYFDSPHWNSFIEAKEKGKSFFANQLTFDVKNKFYEDLFKLIPSLPEESKQSIFRQPGLAISTVLLENVGLYIENFSGLPYTDEENNTLIRFGNVFQQTYTRFLDLQKAEAQAREAQIEAGLERVRSKTMAMHNSQDVGNTVAGLFDELVALGLEKSARCGIGILDESNIMELWTASTNDNGEMILAIGHLDMALHPLLKGVKKTWCSKKQSFTYELQGEDLLNYFNILNEYPDYHIYIDVKTLPEKIIHNSFYFTDGLIYCFTRNPFTEDLAKVVKRFSGVFGQTYKRYLDLRKAEAQAREAQIEAALEKIRSRSLAMHTSQELREVIAVFFERLNELEVLLGTVGIALFDFKTTNLIYYVGNSIQDPQLILAPYNEAMMGGENFVRDAWSAMVERTELVNKVYNRAQKDIYFEYLFANNDLTHIPGSAREILRKMDNHIVCFFPNNHSALFADSWDGRQYTDDGRNILRRAGKVFEQAYIRFLDLQKAEAQARESQIEAALERVRARAMAMYTSQELGEVTRELRKQMGVLGQKDLDTCVIHLHDESPDFIYSWAAIKPPDSNDTILDTTARVPKKGLLIIEEAMEAYSMNMQDYVVVNEGKKIQQWFEFMQKESPEALSKIIESSKGASIEDAKSFWSFADFAGGSLLMVTNDQPAETSRSLLRRFANVFGLAYRRFADLKQAEAQAKEAQIEAALERVRTRTMGMQKSEDLRDVAKVLYAQLKELGFQNGIAAINIMDHESGDTDSWSEGFDDGYDLPEKYHVPYFEHRGHRELIMHWKSGTPYATVEIAGQEKKSYDNYYFFHTDFIRVPETTKQLMMQQEVVLFSMAYMQYGALTWTPSPISEEQSIVLQRFAKVFEQTYTRFLDLQKAEAQTREAQIEAALERVRSRTMSMHKSDELNDVAGLLFKQISELGIKSWTTGFNVWSEDNNAYTDYITSPQGNVIKAYTIDATRFPVFKEVSDAKKRGDEFWVQYLEGELLRETYKELSKFGDEDQYEKMLEDGFEFPSRQYDHFVFGSRVSLMFITYEPMPQAHEIFKRFGRVFEQSYTRFLDLQKAEAQAREAQIEAALERVRSRSMAMHKSDELLDVIAVVSQQLQHLQLKFNTVSFASNNQEHDYKFWFAAMGDPNPLYIQVPYLKNPMYDRMKEVLASGTDFYADTLTPEESRRWHEHMFVHANLSFLSEETKAYILRSGYARSIAITPGILLIVSNYAARPYTDDENDIIKRFAGVFQQSYTRFLDLKKAEAQAMETTKRASVDRVRAEIASMRTTADLERITPIIWNELTTIGVPFIRCGVFIMDEEQQQVQTHLSSPDGKALLAFRQPYNTPGEISAIVDRWHKKEVYKQHWDEVQFVEFTKILMEQGVVASGEKYLNENRPTSLHLHFLPFLQGMLYVGNTTPLSDDALQLVQNLADAFSTAYARYDDFNKLEAAKQQVDKTLVDLKQAQQQLVQSEKMASLGELTAGIAHEIQNPLNFVNNFSEVNAELIDELEKEVDKGNLNEVRAIAKDIRENEQKIVHHGKRADAIVKGMLQHSRSSGGVKEPTDINALADEYLRLAYHGLRAKDKSFNATMKTDFDITIGNFNIIPQDIGRVILNLITNAFYAVNERAKLNQPGYEPTVSVSTHCSLSSGEGRGEVLIKVKDNGNGMPQKILDKIFQPFFTTKPTGQGTGLGLSLSYDIVKAHGGEIKVETKEEGGSTFTIQIPIS